MGWVNLEVTRILASKAYESDPDAPMQLPSHHDNVRNPLLEISPCRALCDVILPFQCGPWKFPSEK